MPRSLIASPASGESAPDRTPSPAEDAADHEGGFLHAISHPVEHVVEPVKGAMASAAEPVVGAVGAVMSASEPVVGAVGQAMGAVGRAAGRALVNRDGRAQRRLRRLNRRPLPNLYQVHPEARDATPHAVGVRFVPLDEIRGTAVAGIAQRGSDFRPLPPFQGSNWEGRWKRIRRANERLETLPPIDVVKFDGKYWVLDGHNRVAAALYDNAAGLDAVITELVPLDGRMTESATLAPLLADAEELRGGLAAVMGRPFDRARDGGPAREAAGTTEAGSAPEPEPATEEQAAPQPGTEPAPDAATEAEQQTIAAPPAAEARSDRAASGQIPAPAGRLGPA